MMLWVFILTLFGALVATFGGNLPVTLKAIALAVQGWIAAAFHLFILTTSNPFARIADAPFEGRDLNPVLQDPGLAFHPPLLYLGYVGFSIAFSFAIAALIEGRIDAAWARWVRPWVLGAWMCLTLGIAGGSYWAYYELGWGGFWFWDPVENASLDAVARRHRAPAFRGGHGEARRAQGLDHSVGDPGVLAVADRHLPGALGRPDLGACLRHRPAARHFHSRHSGRVHRRGAGFVCLARAAPQAGRLVRADFARGRARRQQSVSDVGLRHRLHRHALSAGARGVDRRQDFGRAAVLQRDVRPAVRAAALGDAVRAAARLEARRPPWRRAAAVCGGVAGGGRGGRRIRAAARRSGAGAVRHRPRGLRHGGRRHRHCRAHHDPARAGRRGAAARGGTAALGVGNRVCAFRHRRHADGHRRRDGLGRRAHCRAAAGRDRRHRELPPHLRGRVRPQRPELPRCRRPFRRAADQRRTVGSRWSRAGARFPRAPWRRPKRR